MLKHTPFRFVLVRSESAYVCKCVSTVLSASYEEAAQMSKGSVDVIQLILRSISCGFDLTL